MSISPVPIAPQWPQDSARVAQAIAGATRRAIAGSESVDLLYSGGLDSSILATQLPTGIRARLLTIGTPQSGELERGRAGAERIGRPWAGVCVDQASVEGALSRHSELLAGLREPQRSVQVAFAIALRATAPGVVLCGQGADELFLGYAHFEGLADLQLRARAEADFDRLRRDDWPVTVELARRERREIRAPYLDAEVIAAASAAGWERRRPQAGGRKGLLREVARILGVPGPIAERPKHALQYSSGIARLVRGSRPPRPSTLDSAPGDAGAGLPP